MPRQRPAVPCQAPTTSGKPCRRTTTKITADCGLHPAPSPLTGLSPDLLGEQATRSRELERWGDPSPESSYELDADLRSLAAMRLDDRRAGHCHCPHGTCGVHHLDTDDPAEAFMRVYDDSVVRAYNREVAESASLAFAEDFDPEDPDAALGSRRPY